MAGWFSDLSKFVAHFDSVQLSQVISHATAPVFLLSAVAAFTSVLMGRYAGIKDRIRILNKIPDTAADRLWLKNDLPWLKQRAKLVHRAIFMSLLAAIATMIIVVFMFGSALLGFGHHLGAAVLFIAALMFFGASLVDFVRELRISLLENDDHE
ncbi:MAG: DUF2721 domain-containing protein [Methylocystis sp.]|jgi:hypothetical protein|nr:DUF2721 domain-containing protein [Methylocystis sp.]MCA3583029.1 DUF2721 domain-containing protein [Methylocystis sp.]MCA3590434.1 DUF2721 domain-containing protein [Methylocystis sp.]